jgi:hypothetical protein
MNTGRATKLKTKMMSFAVLFVAFWILAILIVCVCVCVDELQYLIFVIMIIIFLFAIHRIAVVLTFGTICSVPFISARQNGQP